MRKFILADHVSRNDEYSVCYRQGDVDGACGIYSLLACLDLCGALNSHPSDAIEKFDKRTRLGKALKTLGGNDILFKNGLDLAEIQNFITAGYNKTLATKESEAKGKKVLNFAVENIRQGHPTILGLRNATLDHWVVAAGVELFHDPDDEIVTKILLIDPSEEASHLCPWNNYLSIAQPAKGRYPYCLSEGSYVMCEEALAIWPQ